MVALTCWMLAITVQAAAAKQGRCLQTMRKSGNGLAKEGCGFITSSAMPSVPARIVARCAVSAALVLVLSACESISRRAAIPPLMTTPPPLPGPSAPPAVASRSEPTPLTAEQITRVDAARRALLQAETPEAYFRILETALRAANDAAEIRALAGAVNVSFSQIQMRIMQTPPPATSPAVALADLQNRVVAAFAARPDGAAIVPHVVLAAGAVTSAPMVPTAMPVGSSGGGGSISSSSLPVSKNVVPVLYATDRQPLMPLEQWQREFHLKGGSDYAFFGPEPDPSGTLHYGVCWVSIPEQHRAGSLERPGWLHEEDQLLHVTIRGLFSCGEDEMRANIATMASRSARNDAFVFIHGYNVKFNDAAMRAAQIAYDFNFLGAPILYSWSSGGTLLDYVHDAENVADTVDRLHDFLANVVLKTGASRIHLVAHSMGNRALVAVLKRFAAEGHGPLFGEVVLAAPDVSRSSFNARHAASIRPLASRISLYASSDDRALLASRKLSSHPRLGQSGSDRFLDPAINTIDASGVDTDMLAHSYFANARSVIDDLARVLAGDGVAPDQQPRKLLTQKTGGSTALIYWTVPKN